MLNKRGFILIFIASIFSWGGCSSLTAPRSTVPLRQKMPEDVYGSFLQVTFKSPKGGIDRFAGEFIGMKNDSIVILNQNESIAVKLSDCSQATLILFKNNSGLMTLVGVGGVFGSVFLNGGYVIISGPLWIMGSLITGVTEGSRPNSYMYPLDPWNRFEPYARFPQGVPETVNVGELTVRPDAEYSVKEYVNQ